MGLYINNTKMGMPYINGIKHNAYINSKKIWITGPGLATVNDGEFSFTVQDNGSFEIPTSGVNGNDYSNQSYNWIINWGDSVIETKSGASSIYSTIPHTYSDGKNTHTIKISPNGSITQGWFNAFGSSANQNVANLAKIKSINSVITNKMRTINDYSHRYMFYNCTGLTSIPSNLLPATTIFNHCYNSIFCNCTGLTTLPSGLLPATTLTGIVCYASMFRNCSGLTSIPSDLLPATKLTTNCYSYMFQGCNKLTILPSDLLPATTLIEGCYSYMFQNCSVLTDIGNINAAWFSSKTAQQYMFNNCTAIITPITYAQIPYGWK
jgi:hypothetical protein